MTKYRAKPCIITSDGTIFEVVEIKKYNLEIKGIRFDSIAEAEYFKELLWQKSKGEIKEIICQPRFILQDDPKITYIADFQITTRNGIERIIDIKGMETQVFRMKKKMFESRYPELKLELITKQNGSWVSLDEVKKQKSEWKKAERLLLKRGRK